MDLRERIRVVDDFPVPGISFKDITTLLRDPAGLSEAMKQLVAVCAGYHPDLVVSPESRGFIVGVPLALRLGAGFVPVRKAGKLPADTVSGEYHLEYGADRLEMHSDAVQPGQTVLVADDLIATGGTVKAVRKMVEAVGGRVLACAFLIELTGLAGREALGDVPVVSVITY